MPSYFFIFIGYDKELYGLTGTIHYLVENEATNIKSNKPIYHAVPATVSEELAASISMQEQEKKRETLFGTIIGNGGDDDVRNNE